jgi:Ni,Fe-hydrogenase III large subunit/Ni,Fe-hydrogenase III component G
MLEELVHTLKRNLTGLIRRVELTDGEVYVDTGGESIHEACMFVFGNIDCTLLSLFASDERSIKGGFGVYYSFAVKNAGAVLTLRTYIPEDAASLPSVSREIPCASLFEREITDMYGIAFEGHPDPRELVFHGNWPEGLHPLRKEFDTAEKPPFAARKQEFLRIEGTGVYEIPVGPVHAGIIEPGHFRFSVAGEPVINLEAKLYYVHKGIEKLAENQSFEKALFLSERISGDETVANSLAYCQALEKLTDAGELPERALYTRTILCELERIYNHLGDIGGICTDVAYSFAAYQFTMMRRWCQAINEQLTGSRFLRSSIKPGGVRRDVIRGNEKPLLQHLDRLESEFRETVDIIRENSMFIDRVENTGVIKPEIASDLNAVGPAGRSAGFERDVRRDFPYAAYDRLDFRLVLHKNGDVNCRLNVKIEELLEAIRLIRQAVGIMNSGAVSVPIGEAKPYSHAFGLTEAPRGENCHWLMAGENNTVFRYKIRTPSFLNWPVLCHAVRGNVVPDFPLINKSFNLSYSGNDL